MVVMVQLAIDFSAPVRPRASLGKGRAPAGPSSIDAKAGRDLPPEVYTRDEVQRLLDGPLGRNAKTRTRNRALLVVMWRAGLRVSEALDLRMEDLRPECVFRAHLGKDSGRTWAAIPEHLGSDSGALGQGFRNTWARIPEHLGRLSLNV